MKTQLSIDFYAAGHGTGFLFGHDMMSSFYCTRCLTRELWIFENDLIGELRMFSDFSQPVFIYMDKSIPKLCFDSERIIPRWRFCTFKYP